MSNDCIALYNRYKNSLIGHCPGYNIYLMLRDPAKREKLVIGHYERSELWPHRLGVRTPAFQAENRGSIPRGAIT